MSSINNATSLGLYVGSAIALRMANGDLAKNTPTKVLAALRKLMAGEPLDEASTALLLRTLGATLFVMYLLSTYRQTIYNQSQLGDHIEQMDKHRKNVEAGKKEVEAHLPSA